MIVVHIGLRKSGSSSIQGFLSANIDLLARMGIDYPVARRWERAAHVNLASEIRSLAKFDPGQGTLTQVADHWRRSSGETMILSSEAFEECEAIEAARLKALRRRDGETILIVLILRDLLELMPSSYGEMVKVGRKTHDFDAFFAKRMRDRRVDYFETARRWADAFGWESLRIRLLDSRSQADGGLVDDFLAVIGVEPRGDEARRLRRPGVVNAARGWRVIEAMRALYGGRHGLDPSHPLADAARHGVEKRRFIGSRAAQVGERLGWNSDKGRYLNRAQALECLDVYRAAIDALNSRLGETLPAPLDLDARAFEERAFMPDATHIPREQLEAFYDDVAAAGKRLGAAPAAP